MTRKKMMLGVKISDLTRAIIATKNAKKFGVMREFEEELLEAKRKFEECA